MDRSGYSASRVTRYAYGHQRGGEGERKIETATDRQTDRYRETHRQIGRQRRRE